MPQNAAASRIGIWYVISNVKLSSSPPKPSQALVLRIPSTAAAVVTARVPPAPPPAPTTTTVTPFPSRATDSTLAKRQSTAPPPRPTCRRLPWRRCTATPPSWLPPSSHRSVLSPRESSLPITRRTLRIRWHPLFREYLGGLHLVVGALLLSGFISSFAEVPGWEDALFPKRIGPHPLQTNPVGLNGPYSGESLLPISSIDPWAEIQAIGVAKSS